jgi:hypothetical protein
MNPLEDSMIRSLLLCVAVPLASAAGQAAPVRLTVTSPNQAAFRIIHSAPDSLHGPLVARGRVDFLLAESASGGRAGPADAVEITAVDTTTAVHVEATQNGRVIAGGDGAYLTIRRDTNGVAIVARSSVPSATVPSRKPE